MTRQQLLLLGLAICVVVFLVSLIMDKDDAAILSGILGLVAFATLVEEADAG